MKAYFNLLHLWGPTSYRTTKIGIIDFTKYEVNESDLVDSHLTYAKSLITIDNKDDALIHYEEAKNSLESCFLKNNAQYVLVCLAIANIYT